MSRNERYRVELDGGAMTGPRVYWLNARTGEEAIRTARGNNEAVEYGRAFMHGEQVAEAQFPTTRRSFQVRFVRFTPTHDDRVRTYIADSLKDALQQAEREIDTFPPLRSTDVLGIVADDYEQALSEGVAFNEADGLLVDADETDATCPECERSNGPHYRGRCPH